jgi:bisphosphoglycerate-independent phosphoglycerate mutase (AlkP superfamily)
MKAVNMKLILCIFEQLSRLKIIFIKARYFALDKQRNVRRNISIYSVVVLGHYHLNIWVFQFTIGNY